MGFIALSKIDGVSFNEDTGTDVERSKPCVVNSATIRCFYGRRDDKPGTRITFNDGGGFAVSETPEAVASLLGHPDLAAVLAPAASTASN